MSDASMHNAHAKRRVAAILSCSAIAICATALRFWCKRSTKAGIHAEDWWILGALITGLAAQSTLLWDVLDGSNGNSIEQLIENILLNPSPENIRAFRNYLESIVVSFSLTYVVLFQIKISICLLYRRIFAAPKLRTICLILMGISAIWFVAIEVGNLVTCLPIKINVQDEWKPEELTSGMCRDFQSYFLPTSITEILIDAAILLLPIKIVASLQMPFKTKVFISGIFLLGGFALITGILRVYYTYSPSGTFGRFSDAEIWSGVHFAIAMLCACLPIYRPLLDLGSSLLLSMSETVLAVYHWTSARIKETGIRPPAGDQTASQTHIQCRQNSITPLFASEIQSQYAYADCKVYTLDIEK